MSIRSRNFAHMNTKYVLHAGSTCNILTFTWLVSLETDVLSWAQHWTKRHGMLWTFGRNHVQLAPSSHDWTNQWRNLGPGSHENHLLLELLLLSYAAIMVLLLQAIITHVDCKKANIGKETGLRKQARPNHGTILPKLYLRAKLPNIDIIALSLKW